MKPITAIAPLLVALAFASPAEAARGIVTKKPGGGSPNGRILSYDGTAEGYACADTDCRTDALQAQTAVDFEPVGRAAESVFPLKPDGLSRYAIEGSPKTPTIFFDGSAGILEIKGRSIPENSIEVYEPLLGALDAYAAKPWPETVVQLRLSALDGPSFEQVSAVFKKLEAIHKGGSSSIIVSWFHLSGDTEMLAYAKKLQAAVDFQIQLIEVKRF